MLDSLGLKGFESFFIKTKLSTKSKPSQLSCQLCLKLRSTHRRNHVLREEEKRNPKPLPDHDSKIV